MSARSHGRRRTCAAALRCPDVSNVSAPNAYAASINARRCGVAVRAQGHRQNPCAWEIHATMCSRRSACTELAANTQAATHLHTTSARARGCALKHASAPVCAVSCRRLQRPRPGNGRKTRLMTGFASAHGRSAPYVGTQCRPWRHSQSVRDVAGSGSAGVALCLLGRQGRGKLYVGKDSMCSAPPQVHVRN